MVRTLYVRDLNLVQVNKETAAYSKCMLKVTKITQEQDCEHEKTLVRAQFIF